MKTTPGWLAIVGGPWHGGEYYLPRDYAPGDVVPVTLPQPWRERGAYYIMNLTRSLVMVWGKS